MSKKRIYDLLVIITLLSPLLMNIEAAYYVKYCETGKLKTLNQESCRNGINFGLDQAQPTCACIQGIYRIYTEACEEADGFTDGEICTRLYDDNTRSNSWAIKLAEMPKGFTWNSQGVTTLSANGEWKVTTAPGSVTTKSGSFYALNGKAYAMNDYICVNNVKSTKGIICRYFQEENTDKWTKAAQYSIKVQSDCTGGKELQSGDCFSPLKPSQSECSLSCKAPANNSTGGGSGKPGTMIPKEDFDKNCTNPDLYRNHDNRFLNRKMLLYNVVNQLDMGNQSEGSILESMEPNKTLKIFDFMKNITKSVCPTNYINSEWIDQVVDLFYILHKGNVFRYEEQLGPEQYQWIQDILNTCLANVSQVVLMSKDDGTKGECGGANSGLATGYCQNSDNSSCDHVPVTVDITGEDSHRLKHYVPEVAWNIVDLVHVACFPQFNDSYRMWHVLEQAVERIFTLQIKNLWHFPGWSEKTKTKLLGYGADNNMYNFEVCLQGAYGLRNGDIPRLVRPFSPVYLRKKRAASKAAEKLTTSKQGRTSKARAGEDSGLGRAMCAKSPKDLLRPANCDWDL